jgi:hypothetical protein
MKHAKALNRKARMMEERDQAKSAEEKKADVRAMQNLPLGCALIFDPGWETDATGGITGLCQPVEADLYGCYDDCWWPAQVPDQITNFLEWSDKCAAAERDWRKLDILDPNKS